MPNAFCCQVTAVRLLLPGELAKHAVSEGTKAVTKYFFLLFVLFQVEDAIKSVLLLPFN